MIALPWWLPLGRVPEIEPRVLAERLENDIALQLLDVRTTAEFRRSRIAGAVNVPITELGGRLDALSLDRATFTVTICLSAHRSIPAVRLLRRRGFGEAVQLAGGMRAWWAAGLACDEG